MLLADQGAAILFLFHSNHCNQIEAGRKNSLAPFRCYENWNYVCHLVFWEPDKDYRKDYSLEPFQAHIPLKKSFRFVIAYDYSPPCHCMHPVLYGTLCGRHVLTCPCFTFTMPQEKMTMA